MEPLTAASLLGGLLGGGSQKTTVQTSNTLNLAFNPTIANVAGSPGGAVVPTIGGSATAPGASQSATQTDSNPSGFPGLGGLNGIPYRPGRYDIDDPLGGPIPSAGGVGINLSPEVLLLIGALVLAMMMTGKGKRR